MYPLVDEMYDDSNGVGNGDADTLKMDAPLYSMVDGRSDSISIDATVSSVIGMIAVRPFRWTVSFVPS